MTATSQTNWTIGDQISTCGTTSGICGGVLTARVTGPLSPAIASLDLGRGSTPAGTKSGSSAEQVVSVSPTARTQLSSMTSRGVLTRTRPVVTRVLSRALATCARGPFDSVDGWKSEVIRTEPET